MKKKRKLNSLIIFGLDVEETDKSNKTVNELLSAIGIETTKVKK